MKKQADPLQCLSIKKIIQSIPGKGKEEDTQKSLTKINILLVRNEQSEEEYLQSQSIESWLKTLDNINVVKLPVVQNTLETYLSLISQKNTFTFVLLSSFQGIQRQNIKINYADKSSEEKSKIMNDLNKLLEGSLFIFLGKTDQQQLLQQKFKNKCVLNQEINQIKAIISNMQNLIKEKSNKDGIDLCKQPPLKIPYSLINRQNHTNLFDILNDNPSYVGQYNPQYDPRRYYQNKITLKGRLRDPPPLNINNPSPASYDKYCYEERGNKVISYRFSRKPRWSERPWHQKTPGVGHYVIPGVNFKRR